MIEKMVQGLTGFFGVCAIEGALSGGVATVPSEARKGRHRACSFVERRTNDLGVYRLAAFTGTVAGGAKGFVCGAAVGAVKGAMVPAKMIFSRICPNL